MTFGMDWRYAVAPGLAEFEEMAALAWDRLPDAFRSRAGDLIIRIEDYPTDEVLDALEIEDSLGLLGLYHGVSLDRKSVLDVPSQPDMVFLYRRPLLDEWAESGETLGDLITHVLVHEVGHHFGFSDDDMARIEAAAGGS
ncbi:metallopeptidase family protein [Hyphomicrobium sp. D-2]|uniref:metallopeptidase family protein n=1 Tax=Hyphomicrobium sp. D-2 TaxID=3041621 RepID=UPI00245506A3|nr:metallopeptidase family protein [Hyphomicrobium sp. D-2]MDH4983416.1 metallopeptidase family protein [Hyphomicrobium sp. D-2]